MKQKIVILSLLFTLIITSGFGCKLTSKETAEAMQPVTLTYWRVWDGPDAFEEIIADYKALHPFVTIEYKKLRYSEYEQELLEAFAEDRGPDIFSLHNTWIKKYESKIEPMPASITMAYPVVKGTVKKETVTELRTSKSITLKELQNNFVDVVYDDVVVDVTDDDTGETSEEVLGLPLSVDTLAMYYNKDLLNNAGIAEPPTYWNQEFQQTVKDLTKQDTQGSIIQAGAALGGSTNIERYSDILSILMMQNGAEMLSDGRATFNQTPAALKAYKINPGLEALQFYSDFANPGKEVYTWNDSMDNSLDLFIQGKLAFFFGYAYHLPTIQARAPKLNFSIAKLPQIENNVLEENFANYWVETVSKKSENADIAWDFIQFATKAEEASKYLENTDKPTALKALINNQVDDLDIGVFAEQVLTAKSWYQGEDANATELIFADMIDEANTGEDDLSDIIDLAAKRVQQTIN